MGSPRRLTPELFPSPEISTSFAAPFTRCLLRLRAHPFSRCSSSEFLRFSRSPGRTFRSELHLAWVSCPLRDFTPAQPLSRVAPTRSLRSVLRFSQPLDVFSPRSGSQACFIPRPRPGPRPFRGFSPRAATLPHRKERAPLPLFHRRFTRLFPLSQKPTRSHVRCSSASRLLSAQGRVPRIRLLTSSVPAPLYSFVSSRSLLLSTSVPFYSAPSAHDVCELGLRAFRNALSAFRPYGARAHLAVHPISRRDPPFDVSVSAAGTFRPSPPRASSNHESVRLTAPTSNCLSTTRLNRHLAMPAHPWPSSTPSCSIFSMLRSFLRDRPRLPWRNFFRAPWPAGTRGPCDHLTVLAPNAHRCSFIFSVLSSRDPTTRR